MLAPERQQQILTLLEERGTVRTIDLAEEFQVTDETIRRDLQNLAENGQLSRIHGGASSLSGRPKLQSFMERRSINVDRKRAIALAAVELIQPGRTYAFDSSTTVFELVSSLPELRAPPLPELRKRRRRLTARPALLEDGASVCRGRRSSA